MTHEEAAQSLATERYLLGELSGDDREAFEAHFFSCDVCADDLRTAAAMLQGASTGLAGSASGQVVPMPVGRSLRGARAWYRSPAIPWAAAAALACITTYQSAWVVPALRRSAAPVALAPVVLHPESRGAEASVRLGPGGDPVTLALEINDPPRAGEVTYSLRTQSGRDVVSGRAAAPAAGMPLLLLFPAWTVSGDMHYILTVHDAAPDGRPLGEYRFAVSTP
ncbi:MAG: hypothetical protein V7647_1170 [Acidobacteriota bacterium]|jgi:anti-sigma factor RsiW